MKALVVDRSNTMRSVLNRILSMRGFDVEEAAAHDDAREVLRRMGAANVVLVDSDPSCPEDLAFLTYLRRQNPPATLVIMLVTMEPNMRDIQRALAAGADEYLMKPFNSLQIDTRLAGLGFASDTADSAPS